MDRNVILENFQAISQNQNFEECIQILESVNWDLEKALESIETGSSSSPQDKIIEEHKQERELVFTTEYLNQQYSTTISENKTIADLKSLISQIINNPDIDLNLNMSDQLYEDYTVLRDLNLPDISQIAVVSLTKETSTSSVKGEVYKLIIKISKNGEYQQDLPIDFDGKDTISKVKSHVSALCGSNRVRWSGWPKDIYGSEVTLEESGLGKNATLSVNIEDDRSAPVSSLNNSDVMENDADEDYYGEAHMDLEAIEETGIGCNRSSKRDASLLDSNAYEDPATATFNFSTEFYHRYEILSSSVPATSKCPNSENTSKLPFFNETLEDAVRLTLNCPPYERKPLFIYIHHGESIQANIFCTQTLCYKEICSFFIQSQYKIWPWDITHRENRNYLNNWITRIFGNNFTVRLRIIEKDEFPVLAVIGKSSGSYELIDVFDNRKSKDEILHGLWELKLKFHDSQIPDIVAWQEREQREQVKMEQDAAYRESLLLDQIKEQQKDDEEKRIKQEEERRLFEEKRAKEVREEKIELARRSVPSEPLEHNDNIVIIRLRPPSNHRISDTSQLTRRFLFSHTLNHVLYFMESNGFLRSEYKLLMTYPRKNLTELEDTGITLKELGLPKRETLIIETI